MMLGLWQSGIALKGTCGSPLGGILALNLKQNPASIEAAKSPWRNLSYEFMCRLTAFLDLTVLGKTVYRTNAYKRLNPRRIKWGRVLWPQSRDLRNFRVDSSGTRLPSLTSLAGENTVYQRWISLARKEKCMCRKGPNYDLVSLTKCWTSVGYKLHSQILFALSLSRPTTHLAIFDRMSCNQSRPKAAKSNTLV